jgi:hypothetical protein
LGQVIKLTRKAMFFGIVVQLCRRGSHTPKTKVAPCWMVWRAVEVRQVQMKVRERPEKDLPQAKGKKKSARGGKPSRGRRLQRRNPRKVNDNPRPVLRREPGNGSRSRHFLKKYRQSVEKALPTSRQIADIKARAESRRSVNRVPLPPRAEAGLHARQARLIRMSLFWGRAYGKWAGVTAEAGRRHWRSALFRAAVGDEGRAGQLDRASTLFGEQEGSVDTHATAALAVRQRGNQAIGVAPPPSLIHSPREGRRTGRERIPGMRRICQWCGRSYGSLNQARFLCVECTRSGQNPS